MNLAAITSLLSETLAIHPPALTALVERVSSTDIAALEAAAARAAGAAPFGSRVRRDGGVGHVAIRGVLVRGSVPEWLSRYFGVAGLDDIRADLSESLADPEVKSIVLEVDSPGGTAAGLSVLGDYIQEVRRTKRVDAVVSGMAASAGYFLAAQAERIVSERDAIIGSIGTFARVIDSSEAYEREGLRVHVMRSGLHKGMGTPGVRITPEQLAMHQAVIDDFAAVFVDAVASGRRLERERVQALATGAHWLAPAALELGLIDAIGGAASLSTTHPRRGPRAEDDMSGSTTPNNGAQAPATPAAPPAPPQPRAATVAELEANFPGEPAFALEQLKAGATLEQAQNAFTRVQLERAKQAAAESEAALAKAQAELAEAKKSAPRAEKAASGVDPSAVAGSTAAVQETPLAKAGDFVNRARALSREKGISYTEAATQLAKDEPDLHAQYVDRQHDEFRARQRRSKATTKS